MRGLLRGCVLVVLALMLAGAGETVWAQVATTTVTDTVYRADGTAAGGSVVISWSGFTTAGGSSVAAGTTAVTIGTGGALSVSLVPNAGSTPMGTYYTAVYHLDDGTTSKEYWVVPVAVPGGGPVHVAAIKNEVLPASVAMQTVSKQYVDAAISAAQTGFPEDTSPYVLKAGDTMTGPLVLPADPVTSNQAADKNYVDENLAAVSAGLAGKVSLLPSGTQVVSQPAGTELEVNRLNGSLYATPFAVGTTSGVANALAAPDCGANCRVVVDPKDTGDPVVPSAIPSGAQVVDQRGGAHAEYTNNPTPQPSAQGGTATAEAAETTETMSQVAYATASPGSTLSAGVQTLTMNALTGGSNLDPGYLESPPYFKNTYSAQNLLGYYNTAGQHDQANNIVNCYGVGDCLASSMVIYSAGGFRDPSDEGTHQGDFLTAEDPQVFTATCTSGCTTGSTSVVTTATASGGTQGEGRYLIDKNPAKDISTGSLTGGDDGVPFANATFTGSSFPVSVFLATAAAATSQPTNVAPGTVTLPIETSGAPAGFATNTAALPGSSGIACVADPDTAGYRFPNYEMAPYTAVDGTHLQLTLNKAHANGAVVAVGGLCGYGVEQTADTIGNERQVFPVVGSTSATSLLYADGDAAVLGRAYGTRTTTGYINASFSVAAIARSGNVVTVTTSAPLTPDPNGLMMTVSGVADPSYDGTFVVTTTGDVTLTYNDSGADSTSSGGTVGILTGSYVLYPMAEVLGVYDAATKLVDGLLTLAPNTAPWATGDALEEPHFPNIYVHADAEQILQNTPRSADDFTYPGKVLAGEAGPGTNGWSIDNAVNAGQYFGAGGTHHAPDSAFVAMGVWTTDFEATAGMDALIHAHCNLYGCGRFNSDYDLFELDSNTGADHLRFAPESDTVLWNMDGQVYSFSPTSFTASTINVGTLNATTILGGISGPAITSGTINPARLPVFGPSGSTHAVGAVPDPGATAGSTRFLREDGTWDVPTGGGGGSSSAGSAGAVQIAGSGGSFADSGCTGGSGAFNCSGQIVAGGGIVTGSQSYFSAPTVVTNTGTAVSGTNFGSTSIIFTTSFWNGTADGYCSLFAAGMPANNGTNPPNYVDFTSAGCVGLYGIEVGSGAWFARSDGSMSAGSGGFQVESTGAITKVPSVASGTASNTDLVGTLTLPAGSTTTASYTFGGSYASAPVCMVQPQNATPATVAAVGAWSAQVSATTLSVTTGAAAGSAVTFGYVCAARN
jgi:hypothetical protein